MEFLEIDGSFGEGGGQIVRTAITLSCILHKPVIVKNIRKGRKNPGLKPQHLMALKILRKICDAKIENLKVGSTSLQFSPNKVKSIELNEDVGTAGSIPLIFQVLIPLVAISKKRLKLSIKGGTDVLWSPTIDYTRFILKDVYSRMGINFSINVIKRGYYPRGGGLIKLEVFPTDKITPIILKQRKTKKVDLRCTFSKIKSEIISKEIDKIRKHLTKNNFVVEKQIKKEIALDSGASVMISCVDIDS
ncbi:MAG: RNA 3'-terminal phosphate cyclase, partial [Nitrosopumilaceae archaeon]